MLQEVETSPSSARYSGLAASSRHSLSSTERSSASRNSTENYQRPTQAEPAVVSVTAGRPVTDTGYQTAQLDEVMARASEFTPGILDRLKQKTNDVFYNLGDEDSAESYKQLNFTPDSLSTGIGFDMCT